MPVLQGHTRATDKKADCVSINLLPSLPRRSRLPILQSVMLMRKMQLTRHLITCKIRLVNLVRLRHLVGIWSTFHTRVIKSKQIS